MNKKSTIHAVQYVAVTKQLNEEAETVKRDIFVKNKDTLSQSITELNQCRYQRRNNKKDMLRCKAKKTQDKRSLNFRF